MPQMKVEHRYCSKPRKKYDAPQSNYVTCEIRDGSSPESSPPFKSLFQNGQLVKCDHYQGDTCKRTKNGEKTVSVLSKNRDPKDPPLNDLGLYPSHLVNGHCSNAITGDIKSSLFSDNLLSSLTCKRNKEDMKVINGCDTQVFGDFSDLLSSISLQDHGSKGNVTDFEVCNGDRVVNDLFKSTSSYSDEINNFTTGNNGSLSSILSPISFSELDVSQNSSFNYTKQNRPEINNNGLSDILSSISFDEMDTSQQNGCTSSLNSSLKISNIKNPDSKELFSDFPLLNSHTLNSTSNTIPPSKLQKNSSLSDMLSSITFHENSKVLQNGLKSSSFSNRDLGNDSLLNLKELSTEFLGSNVGVSQDNCFSFSTDLNDASDYKFSKTTDPINSFKNNESSDFSFFSVSPDNVFSSMLSNLHTSPNLQEQNINVNTDNISMLDLLKSVNTDSSSSLSGYLDMPSKSEINTDKQAAPDDISEILDIDLSVCVKSSEDTDTICQDRPVNNICIDGEDIADVKLEDYMKPVFDEVDSNRPRVNQSQSLFAKALSCKPKINPELLRKASLVKSELYKLYFNRELPDKAALDKNFKIKEDIYSNNEMVVCKTNNCMISFKGRRFCPYEVN